MTGVGAVLEVVLEGVKDSLRMIPWLLAIYVGIEFVEFRWGEEIRRRVMRAGMAGPVLGALFGALPQCGFSVISSSLYTMRLITPGTLLAVYLSTSDEAIPVILAQPEKAGLVWPLLATKVAIGLAAGYAVDLAMGVSTRLARRRELSAAQQLRVLAEGGGESLLHAHQGCCCHTVPPEKPPLKELLAHPVKHTLRVFLFVMAVSVALNLAIHRVGEENLGRLLLANTPLQPLLTGLVGLIPNCAASVVITQAYLKGALSFGSAIAGLSASAGLGTLVLLRENRDLRDTLRVVGLLLGVSVAAGTAIQYLYG
ncbi:MAG: putative manganese transporter [Betaproteobacteria bacterium]